MVILGLLLQCLATSCEVWQWGMETHEVSPLNT